ncbi:MAG: hypothetical protein V1686_00075 [Patescibacteria group bacterium]
MNNDLINYIKQCREQKISDGQIRTALLGAGWKVEDINEGFNSFNGINVPAPSASNSVGGKLASAPQILKEAWGIYKKRFLVFVLLTIIPLILTTILIAVVGGVGLLGLALIFTGLAVWKIISFALIAILLFFLFTATHVWGQASLIYAINENESGLKFIEAIKKGWHKIFPYWIVSALIGVIVMCGSMLFLVPGILFMVWFSLAFFVLTVEDTKGMSALYKSREYVRNHWWAVLWRLIFMCLISVVISQIFSWIFKLINVGWIEMIGTLLVSCVLLPLMLVYNFLTYKKLKELKGDFVFVPDKSTRTGVRIVVIIVITLLVLGIVANFLLAGFLIKRNSSNNNLQNPQSNDPRRNQSVSYEIGSRDARRRSDIILTVFALQMYYDDNGSYPKTNGCNVDSWSLMMSTLQDKKILSNVPTDPLNSGDYTYKYSSDGKDYILSAYFEDSTNHYLGTDVDGVIMGCDCGDSHYCLDSDTRY